MNDVGEQSSGRRVANGAYGERDVVIDGENDDLGDDVAYAYVVENHGIVEGYLAGNCKFFRSQNEAW